MLAFAFLVFAVAVAFGWHLIRVIFMGSPGGTVVINAALGIAISLIVLGFIALVYAW